MVLIWPGSLLGLIVLAAVAAWTLFRPSRQVAVVGSLRLWQEALDALDRSGRRSARRVTVSWVLLLAGAVAAVAALARPVLHTEGLARRVSVAICPSAELGDAGTSDALTDAVAALLDRLAPGDRVQLLRPILPGGASGYLSVEEARQGLGEIRRLPVAAGDVLLPDAAPDSQHVYRFAPAGAETPRGARVTVIELPTSLPPVTVDAVGAVELAPGRAQVFVSLRRHAASPWSGTVRVLAVGGTTAPRVLGAARVAASPDAREDVVLDLPAAEAMTISVEDTDGRAVTAAYLARGTGMKRKVALVGRDEPLLRRYVSADETLDLVASPASADVVIVNRGRPPAGKAALVIDPSADPPGWRRGSVLSAVVLDQAHVAADDAVLRGVNLRSVAVRRLRPWVAADSTSQKVLVALGNEAVVLRDPDGPGAAEARRVYVAFELSADNTNLGMSEAFAVLLANAMRWLAPGRRARPTYGYLRGADLSGGDAWQRLAGATPGAEAVAGGRWPGIFRDEAGALRAVSLVGLSAGWPRQPPPEAVAAAPLPGPVPVARPVELWTLLSILAAGLWLAGWAVRLR